MSTADVELPTRDITRDYNHSDDAEYKKLRDLANREYKLRGECFAQSKQAYNNGDGAEAKRLSEKGKEHGRKMDEYNEKASRFVFVANNADSSGDEIDLHGLYVKEAIEILDVRLQEAINTHQSHLNVITGKGIHSENHIAKLKPAVIELCEKHGLKHHTESGNAGVVVIDLSNTSGYQGQGQMQYGQHQTGSHGQQQQHHQQQQQQESSDDCMGLFIKVLTFCFKKALS